jgi:hypothetical protein
MKKLYFALLIFLCSADIYSQIPTSSLTGYWPLNGNANDLSGQLNNGSVVAATLTTDRFGNPNAAYGFNGTSNYISVPNSPSIDFSNTNDFSVCYWVNTYNNPSTTGTPLSKSTYGQATGYQFVTNTNDPGYCNFPGQIAFFVSPGSNADACANSAVCSGTNLNTWFFIVGMYDGTLNQATIYVNGVLQNDVGSRSGNISTANNLIFGGAPGGYFFFKGALDDIRIYRRKLTQPEVTILYNECQGPPSVPVNATPVSNQTVCVGNSATVSATSASNTITWFATASSTLALGTGTNYVSPTLAQGTYSYFAETTSCGTSTRIPITFTVVNGVSPTNATPSSNQTVCVGTSATISATSNGTILWYSTLNGTFAVGSGTDYVTPTLAGGNYTYYAEGSACPGASRTPVPFSVLLCAGMNSYSAIDLNVTIYPNPSEGIFIFESQSEALINITTIFGQLILEERTLQGKNKLDISQFSKGIYFCSVQQGEKRKTIKIIKD